MSDFEFVTIEVKLTDLESDKGYSAYKQTIPVNVLSKNPHWLAQVISIVNNLNLEVKHV